jgi:hypothetical protein
MQSLMSPQKEEDRATGVLAVAGLCALTGVASLVLAALLFRQAVPLSYGSVLLPGGLEQSGPISFLIYGAATLVLAWGLWTRRGWGRRLTMLAAGVGVALAVPAISSAVIDGRVCSMVGEGLQIMVRVAVIYYLSQEPVREWFCGRAGPGFPLASS